MRSAWGKTEIVGWSWAGRRDKNFYSFTIVVAPIPSSASSSYAGMSVLPSSLLPSLARPLTPSP